MSDSFAGLNAGISVGRRVEERGKRDSQRYLPLEKPKAVLVLLLRLAVAHLARWDTGAP